MLLGEYDTDWGVPRPVRLGISAATTTIRTTVRAPALRRHHQQPDQFLSSFGYRGNPIMGGGKGVLGTNPNSTWGVGARIKSSVYG